MSEMYDDDAMQTAFRPIQRQTTLQEHFPLAKNTRKYDDSPSAGIAATLCTSGAKRVDQFHSNFLEDTSLYFSYFLSHRTLPTEQKILDQYGFSACQSLHEKKQLLHVYWYVIFVGYATEVPFVFKRLQLLHQAFLEDKLEEFILIGYGLQRFQDDFFYWFMRNSSLVKWSR